MPSDRVRFLLDEHYPGWLADALMADGADAVSLIAHRPDLRGVDDRQVLEDPGTYRVLFGGRAAREPGGDGVSPQGAGAFQTLVDGIAGAQAAGAVRAGHPFALAVPVWAALHGIATLRQARPGFPWPPVHDLVDEVVAGLLGLDQTPPEPVDEAAGAGQATG